MSKKKERKYLQNFFPKIDDNFANNKSHPTYIFSVFSICCVLLCFCFCNVTLHVESLVCFFFILPLFIFRRKNFMSKFELSFKNVYKENFQISFKIESSTNKVNSFSVVNFKSSYNNNNV